MQRRRGGGAALLRGGGGVSGDAALCARAATRCSAAPLHPGWRQAAPLFRQLLEAALELVEACPCSSRGGCPACVFSPACSAYNGGLDKAAAAVVLRETLGQEAAHLAQRSAEEAVPPPG